MTAYLADILLMSYLVSCRVNPVRFVSFAFRTFLALRFETDSFPCGTDSEPDEGENDLHLPQA